MKLTARHAISFARLPVCATLCIAFVVGSGCASSERALYQEHLSATVSPGPAASDDVIIAFGLDRPSVPDSAVARSE